MRSSGHISPGLVRYSTRELKAFCVAASGSWPRSASISRRASVNACWVCALYGLGKIVLRRNIILNPQAAGSDANEAVAEKQAALNDSTRGQWQMYASHRQAIERLIVSALQSHRGRICVLGAGNCNDLDLEWLATVFSEVHLVDIDPAALAAGSGW